jgi:hypothetical protein
LKYRRGRRGKRKSAGIRRGPRYSMMKTVRQAIWGPV